jgi:hypothetical protein
MDPALLLERTASLTVVDVGRSEVVRQLDLKGNGGVFSTRLIPGHYAISSLSLRETTLAGALSGVSVVADTRIYGIFDVPPDTPLLYVGDLDLSFEGGGVHLEVFDRMPDTLAQFNRDFPMEALRSAAKSIMKVDRGR